MKSSPSASHWTKDKRFIADFTKINLVFWGLIALINYLQDVVLMDSRGYQNPWTFSAIFSFDWPLWAAFTPFIIRLAVRYPLSWKHMYSSMSRQFGFATIVVVMHAVLEFLLIEILTSVISPNETKELYLPGYLLSSIHTRYIIYFLIAGGVQRFDLYFKYHYDTLVLKSQLVAAQLESLRIQLQPHFLFNTHQTIIALLLKNENEKAGKMLIRLSDLLRKTLERSKEEFITVRQELEMVKLYMDIQQIRFQDKIKYHVEVNAHVQSLKIPSFLLQPLIENAVTHGIEPAKEAGEIALRITDRAEKGLLIEIRNDGINWMEGSVERLGLTNTRLRLEQLYGDNHIFKIENPPSGKGTQVMIELPLAESRLG